MLNYSHPVMLRRQSLGLSLNDLQVYLARHGFNYSVEMLQSFERGERRLPTHNPGFVVVLSQYLGMSVGQLLQLANQARDTFRARDAFRNKMSRLRPQNQFLLRFVLEHPFLTDLPGFDFMFEIVKSIALQLPDEWFTRK